jgi:hypothetical protein
MQYDGAIYLLELVSRAPVPCIRLVASLAFTARPSLVVFSSNFSFLLHVVSKSRIQDGTEPR